MSSIYSHLCDTTVAERRRIKRVDRIIRWYYNSISHPLFLIFLYSQSLSLPENIVFTPRALSVAIIHNKVANFTNKKVETVKQTQIEMFLGWLKYELFRREKTIKRQWIDKFHSTARCPHRALQFPAPPLFPPIPDAIAMLTERKTSYTDLIPNDAVVRVFSFFDLRMRVQLVVFVMRDICSYFFTKGITCFPFPWYHWCQ